MAWFRNSTFSRRVAQGSLAVLMVATSFAVAQPEPAEAGLLDRFRGLGRRSGGRASGRARGGAVRDEACLLPEATDAAIASERAESKQVVALIPDNTLQKTAQANPEIFVHVPFDRNTHNMVLVFELAETGSENPRNVIAGPLPFSLPDEPGLVRFQVPSETPLALDKTYEWTFRLLCRGNQLTLAGQPDAVLPTPATYPTPLDIEDIQIPSLGGDRLRLDRAPLSSVSVRQEIYGQIQRQDTGTALNRGLPGIPDARDRQQIYLDQGIWFELVSDLAMRQSSEWETLLADFGLTGVNPTPKALMPTASTAPAP